MMNNAMKLEFDALSENEALARMVMAAFTAPLNPTVRQLTEIKTAVSEAVTNCIVHGYAGKSGKVRLSAYINDGVLTVTVSDDGAGIGDISRAMEPFFTTQPEQERSGMGFSIMESFMDGVTVRSAVGVGTDITMKKQLKEAV